MANTNKFHSLFFASSMKPEEKKFNSTNSNDNFNEKEEGFVVDLVDDTRSSFFFID